MRSLCRLGKNALDAAVVAGVPVKAFTQSIRIAETSVGAFRNIVIRSITVRSKMEKDDNTGIIRPGGIPPDTSWRSVGVLWITFKSPPAKACVDFNDIRIDTVL